MDVDEELSIELADEYPRSNSQVSKFQRVMYDLGKRAGRGQPPRRQEDQCHLRLNADGPALRGNGPPTNVRSLKMRDTPYREVLAPLVCVDTMTRPNLPFAAHNLAKYGDNGLRTEKKL